MSGPLGLLKEPVQPSSALDSLWQKDLILKWFITHGRSLLVPIRNIDKKLSVLQKHNKLVLGRCCHHLDIYNSNILRVVQRL